MTCYRSRTDCEPITDRYVSGNCQELILGRPVIDVVGSILGSFWIDPEAIYDQSQIFIILNQDRSELDPICDVFECVGLCAAVALHPRLPVRSHGISSILQTQTWSANLRGNRSKSNAIANCFKYKGCALSTCVRRGSLNARLIRTGPQFFVHCILTSLCRASMMRSGCMVDLLYKHLEMGSIRLGFGQWFATNCQQVGTNCRVMILATGTRRLRIH